MDKIRRERSLEGEKFQVDLRDGIPEGVPDQQLQGAVQEQQVTVLICMCIDFLIKG
jgi:hypothetical protein